MSKPNVTDYLVSAQNISFKYGAETVLENLSFNLSPSDFCVLVGPNGAGKTTLVKILTGIEKKFSGSLELFHTSSKKFKNSGQIAYLPQRLNQTSVSLPTSVEDILNTNLFKTQDEVWVKNILEKLHILEFKNKLISQLSVGQRQRVWLARSLISKPQLVILDEPISGVDANNQIEFYSILADMLKIKIAIILVSHELETVAKLANKVWCLNQKLIVHNSVQEFTSSQDFAEVYGQNKTNFSHHH